MVERGNMALTKKEAEHISDIGRRWEDAKDEYMTNFDSSEWTYELAKVVARHLEIDPEDPEFDDLFQEMQEAGIFDFSYEDLVKKIEKFLATR